MYYIEDDARVATKLVEAEDVKERKRQEQVDADQRMAVQTTLQEAHQPPRVSAAPVTMLSVLRKPELPVLSPDSPNVALKTAGIKGCQ